MTIYVKLIILLLNLVEYKLLYFTFFNSLKKFDILYFCFS
jgi:hypothetical protein